jgi:hypothetical protein
MLCRNAETLRKNGQGSLKAGDADVSKILWWITFASADFGEHHSYQPSII